MIKLILNIIGVVIIIIFIGLNMETKVDIHFWFNHKLSLENIPLYVALGASFLLGILVSIPYYLKSIFKKNKKKEKTQKPFKDSLLKKETPKTMTLEQNIDEKVEKIIEENN